MMNKYLRRKVLLVLILLLTLSTTSIVVGNTVFSDLIDDYSKDAIYWGIENNIVSGYPDGTFQPRESVTEAEWLSMMLKYYSKGKSLPKAGTGEHWAQSIYDQALKYGLPVRGKLNVKARSIPSTRKELARIVAAVHGFDLTYPQAVEFMYDNDFSAGSDPNKKTYNTYMPDDNVQRQQAIMFLMKIHNQVKARGGIIYRGEFYILNREEIRGIYNMGIKAEGEPDWDRFNTNNTNGENDKPTEEDIYFDPIKHIDGYNLLRRSKALEYENLFLDSITIQGNKLNGRLPIAPNGFTYDIGIWVDYLDGSMEYLASTDPHDSNRIKEGESFTKNMRQSLSDVENTFIKVAIRNERTEATSGWSILDYITGNRLVKP